MSTSIIVPNEPLIGSNDVKNIIGTCDIVMVSMFGYCGILPVVNGLTKIKIVTVMIGPIEAIPTKPKLSFFAFFPPRTTAIPAPNDKINGTVADPVVTPPESKINGMNDALEGSITTKINNMNVIA